MIKNIILETKTSFETIQYVKNMAIGCCKKHCKISEIERICCRTLNCLKSCYGDDFASPPKNSNFKFYDILIKPNPIHHRNKHHRNTSKNTLKIRLF